MRHALFLSAGAVDLAERECFRCGKKGHDARNCPTIGDPTYDKKRVRLPAGIPVEALTASGEGEFIPNMLLHADCNAAWQVGMTLMSKYWKIYCVLSRWSAATRRHDGVPAAQRGCVPEGSRRARACWPCAAGACQSLIRAWLPFAYKEVRCSMRCRAPLQQSKPSDRSALSPWRHSSAQAAPALEAPTQQAAGAPALPSTSQPAGQVPPQQPLSVSQPLLHLTAAPHAATDGSAGPSGGNAAAATLPQPQLAGEEFLGLPMPFGGVGGSSLPFPSGVLPEGPAGLVMQAFATDRPLTPAEYEQLKLATQVIAGGCSQPRVPPYANAKPTCWRIHLTRVAMHHIKAPTSHTYVCRRMQRPGAVAAGVVVAVETAAGAAPSATASAAAAAGLPSATVAAGAAAAAIRRGATAADAVAAAQQSVVAALARQKALVVPRPARGSSLGTRFRSASRRRPVALGRPCSSSDSQCLRGMDLR